MTIRVAHEYVCNCKRDCTFDVCNQQLQHLLQGVSKATCHPSNKSHFLWINREAELFFFLCVGTKDLIISLLLLSLSILYRLSRLMLLISSLSDHHSVWACLFGPTSETQRSTHFPTGIRMAPGPDWPPGLWGILSWVQAGDSLPKSHVVLDRKPDCRLWPWDARLSNYPTIFQTGNQSSAPRGHPWDASSKAGGDLTPPR